MLSVKVILLNSILKVKKILNFLSKAILSLLEELNQIFTLNLNLKRGRDLKLKQHKC